MRNFALQLACCAFGIILGGLFPNRYAECLSTPSVQVTVITADGVRLHDVRVNYQANRKAFGFVTGPGGIPVPGSYVKSEQDHVYTNTHGRAIIKPYHFPRRVREPSFHIWVSSIKVVKDKGCATGYVVIDSQRLINGQVVEQQDYACRIHAQGAEEIARFPASVTCRTIHTWAEIQTRMHTTRERCK